jgi:hypothetical protein
MIRAALYARYDISPKQKSHRHCLWSGSRMRGFRMPAGTRNPYMGMVNYKRHHVDIVMYLRGNP